jgi:hypothetical protein
VASIHGPLGYEPSTLPLRHSASSCVVCIQVQVQVTVGQSILVTPPPPPPDFFYCRQLESSCCGAPSLTSGRICDLLVQFAVTLWFKSSRTHDHTLLSHLSQVKVTLQPTISRPVRLGVRRPSGTSDQFFYLLEIFF